MSEDGIAKNYTVTIQDEDMLLTGHFKGDKMSNYKFALHPKLIIQNGGKQTRGFCKDCTACLFLRINRNNYFSYK